MTSVFPEQQSAQLQKLVEASIDKNSVAAQKLAMKKLPEDAVKQIVSVTIADATIAKSKKLTLDLKQVETEQKEMEMAARELGKLQNLSQPIASCNCNNRPQNNDYLTPTTIIQVSTNVSPENPTGNNNNIVIKVDKSENDLTSATLNNTKLNNYNVFDTPSSYEVTTKNMEIRSRVSQSLKDFNIDNLDNPADVKDQILAKAITTLVNQSSRISTAILALIKT
tara:strand:+ start:64 stop:735 length:672 start_codon:yes stop_codon:yes gene_type:complete